MLFSQKEKSVIYEAFDMYYTDYCKALPSNEELSYISFTKQFEEKILKLIEREKKFYFYWINTVTKRVAIILLAILITFTTITFSVKALREPTISFIVETFEKFSYIVFFDNSTINNDKYFKKATLGYVPEGFELESEYNDEVTHKEVYVNYDNSSTILFLQKINDGSVVQANTEDIEYENIYINDREGIYYSNKGNNTIVFSTDKYVFTITGTISKEELIKIYEFIDDPQFEIVTPTYIPNGFTVQSSDLSSVTYDVLYVGEDNYSTILYCQNINDGATMQINTQNTTYEEFTIKDNSAIYYSNKGTNTIILSGEKYIYTIEGTIPKEELIKIAESIEIK